MFNSKFLYGIDHSNEGGRMGDPIQERAAQVRAMDLYEKVQKRKAILEKRQEVRDKKNFELGYNKGMIYALYNEGYGYSEIAAKTGLPESTVRGIARYIEEK